MSKRQRTSSTTSVRRSKRPIDKLLTNVKVNNLVAAKQDVTLYDSAAFPGTITGLRWSLAVVRSGGTATTFGEFAWAIVLVPAGSTISTISLTSAGSLYDPEQNVLAFGRGCTFSAAGEFPIMFDGSTKAMRKLKTGDKLVFTNMGTATERHDIAGTVQFFYKT
jgi:hypothetical protein